MTMNMKYDANTKNYIVDMNDKYDFTEWRKIISNGKVSFSNAANNLGTIMQKCGMMIPYKIDLSFRVSA